MKRVHKLVWFKSLTVLILLLVGASSVSATTVIIPSDDDMIMSARVIVRGKVLSVDSAIGDRDRIYTYITIKVSEVIKGQISDRKIVIKELGGQVGDQLSVVFGNPQFKRGEKVLLYLDTWADGSLRTHQMFLGKFNIEQDSRTGREMAVRSSADEGVRVLPKPLGESRGKSTERMELGAYIEMIRSRLAANIERSREFEETYYHGVPTLSRPPEYDEMVRRGGVEPQFTLITSSGARWPQPDSGQPVTYTFNPNPAPAPAPQVVVDPNDVAAAANAWSTVSGCSLQLASAGALIDCYTDTLTPGINVISNNCDGRNSPSTGCASILAWGGYSRARYNPKIVSGQTFQYEITQGFISFNPYASCSFGDHCNVQEITTHEMGHALGLGHSADSTATMYAYAHFDGRCASTRTDDQNGIRFIYPGSGSGGPLSIVTSTLAGGTVGTAYSQALAASGGTGSYTWSLVAGLGSLPTGLTLSPSGAISGTPSASGTFNFTVQVQDSAAATAQKALSIVVAVAGTAYDAQFVSQTVPASVQPGALFSVNMKFRNTGTQTWSGPLFYLVTQNPAFNTTWGGGGGANAVSLASFTIAAGQQLDVTFSPTAPTTPGSYNFQWQPYQQSGVGFFGQMSTNVAIQVGGSVTITTASPLVGGTVGTAYSQTLAASGGTSPYSWSLIAGLGSLPTGLSLSTGGVISGNPSAAGTFNFTVQANDSASGTAQKAFSITIASAPTPVTITTASPLNGGTVGSAYSQTLAASGGTSPYTWSVVGGLGSLPTGLSLSSGGVISGNPSAAGTFNFTVQANDSASGTAQKAFSITIASAPTPVTITTASTLNGGTVGTSYSQTLAASGGTSPYSWSLVAGLGSLPTGLSLSTGGVISGNPSAAGTFNFTVQANDSASGTAQKAFSITIAAAPTPVTITTASTLNGGTVGTAYSQTLAASGGTSPYSWSLVSGLGSLPTGLSLSTSGVISGNPSAAGAFNFTIRASDSASGSAQKAFSITVAAAKTPPSIQGSTSLAAISNSPFSYQLSVTGGTSPFVWAITSGGLPPGIGMNSATGLISGTPSATGLWSLMVQVTDGDAAKDQKNFTINVAPPALVIGATTMPGGQVGSPFNSVLTATGGIPSYRWALLTGSLPPGLALNADTGSISGLPTQPGNFNFTVRVTDAQGVTAGKSLSIAVTPAALRFVTRLLMSAARLSSYSEALSVTGGISPYNWSITAGRLPNGLTLDPAAGVISGTPLENGQFAFTVMAIDQSSGAISKDLQLVVAEPETLIHIDRVKYKGGSQKLLVYGVNFDKAGLLLIDGVQVSGNIKSSKVVVNSLVLPPGVHEIRLVTSAGMVSNAVLVTIE